MKKVEPRSPSSVRQHNAALVLRAIQTKGTISRPELADATGLSLPTVNEITGVLLRDRRVVRAQNSDDDRPMRRGPKAERLSFNAAAGSVLGIDIGPERVVVLVADLSGRLLGRTTRIIGPREALRPAPLLAELEDVVSATLRAAGVMRTKLRAAGVGVPAIIDPASGRLSLVPALPGWEGLPLAERLQPTLPCPIIVNTDVQVASLAESRFGAAQGASDAIYVHLGVGIGLGILIEGKHFPGFEGAAGQIGNLPIGDSGEPPEAGFGQFEWSAGSSAFARLGRRALLRARHGSKLRLLVGDDLDAIGPTVIAEAARLGDRDAKRIIDKLAEQLARGLAAVICVLNPGTVVLGGEIAQIGSLLLGLLRQRVATLVPRPPRHITVSALGDDAVALGAVQQALAEAEGEIFAWP
jgi:predicted NBD/HSP70 family sugar kinase